MKSDRFNPATYTVIDNITGETVPIQIFIEKIESGCRERAYAKTLAEYIGVVTPGNCRLLAYLIKIKTTYNLVSGTEREIALASYVSEATVSRLFKLLISQGYLEKVRNGCYMLSPKLLVHGHKVQGAMLLRVWGKD
jgi:hypothetical protein